MTSRMRCTVDGCEWFHDDTGPQPLTASIVQIMLAHYTALDAVLAEHMATHEPVEFLRTIARLSQRVAELERAAASEVTR